MLTDRQGLPLAVKTTGANVRDETQTLPLLKAMPAVPTSHGRLRRQPRALYGDRGYGFPRTIAEVQQRGIVSKLDPRASPHGSGLGTVRYVVERSLAWFGQFRRLKICYEKHGQYFQAFHDLAACLLCFARLRQVTAGL